MAIVYNSIMTGDELKRIYKNSEMEANDFASILSKTLTTSMGREEPFLRHHLYTQFARANKSIDADIEKSVKATPELAKLQMLLSVDDKSTTEVSQDSPELMGKALDMINETLKMIRDSLMIIADDNKMIKEDASIYRSIVQQGIKEGIVKFVPPKKVGT